jgi:hypothetical protein
MPATLAHELTHWLVSLPWAEQSGVCYTPAGFDHVAEWGDDVPTWAIILTSIAPTLLGSLVGLIGLWRLFNAPPGSTRAWLVTGSIAGWWVIYVAPSADDLDFSAKYTSDTEDTQNNG